VAGVTATPGGSTLVTCVEDERLEFQDGMQVPDQAADAMKCCMWPASPSLFKAFSRAGLRHVDAIEWLL
jgi:hypothetical protein